MFDLEFSVDSEVVRACNRIVVTIKTLKFEFKIETEREVQENEKINLLWANSAFKFIIYELQQIIS